MHQKLPDNLSDERGKAPTNDDYITHIRPRETLAILIKNLHVGVEA